MKSKNRPFCDVICQASEALLSGIQGCVKKVVKLQEGE